MPLSADARDDRSIKPTAAADSALARITDWLIDAALKSFPLDAVLESFCSRLVDAGIPVARAHITMRALHPEYGSVAFRWHMRTGRERLEFARAQEAPEDWTRSPLHYILSNDIAELRQNLLDPEPHWKFPILDDLREEGMTDYVVFKRFFPDMENSAVAEGDVSTEGMMVSFSSDAPEGLSAYHIDTVRALLPPLAVALKCGSIKQTAEDVTATYLGRDASRRVLSGDIVRGSSQTISAVILYFDLQGFTQLSETHDGPQIIELLNAYFGEAVDIVEAHGGDVLKFMGDGMLAIFDLEKLPEARDAALSAAIALRDGLAAFNLTRDAAGQPVTGFTLSLNAGDVLYGNIGGRTRLDFTVIGPAVNTTARILGMCAPLGQQIVVSSNVALPLRDQRAELVSLGAYRMRGVADRIELFTVD